MSLRRKIEKLRLIVKHRRELWRLLHNYVYFAEIPDQSAWGSITEKDEEGIRIAVGAAEKFAGPIVEIGTLFGHTSNFIATIKPRDRRLITVDNFSWNPFAMPADAHRQFARRTLRCALEKEATEIFDGSSEEFFAARPEIRPSMVFIDGMHDHASVARDIALARHAGCPVICGHDYSPINPGVVAAVQEFCGNRFSLFGSVWVHQADGRGV